MRYRAAYAALTRCMCCPAALWRRIVSAVNIRIIDISRLSLHPLLDIYVCITYIIGVSIAFDHIICYKQAEPAPSFDLALCVMMIEFWSTA